MANDIVNRDPTRYTQPRGNARNARRPILELSEQHKDICEKIIFGSSDEAECALVGAELHEPWTPEQVADHFKLKRRNVRWILDEPAIKAELEKQLASYRNGQRPLAARKVAEIMLDPGDGKAADRTVQLKAAQSILGESGGGKGPTVNVGVQINNGAGQNLIAGLHIRLPKAEYNATLDRLAKERDEARARGEDWKPPSYELSCADDGEAPSMRPIINARAIKDVTPRSGAPAEGRDDA